MLHLRSSSGIEDTQAHMHTCPTCFGCHFQQITIQIDLKLRSLARKWDACPIPLHCEVLLEADSAPAQHKVHWLCPGERTGPTGIVFYQHLEGRGRGGAVFRQNVLTCSLKVKCPSIKSVVVRVSKYSANSRLCRWVRNKSAISGSIKVWKQRKKQLIRT